MYEDKPYENVIVDGLTRISQAHAAILASDSRRKEAFHNDELKYSTV